MVTIYMCPHAAIYVSSYCYICVLILVGASSYEGSGSVSSYEGNGSLVDGSGSGSTINGSGSGSIVELYICVLILLYMCPHTAIYVSSYW